MPYSHMRFRFWDSERYTAAQALEFRQLRALYTTHLVPVFGPVLPDAFLQREEGSDNYPRHTANTLVPPRITAVPPATALVAQPFRSFADTVIRTLAVYEEARSQRWWTQGHPNDPTRLLGIFIRDKAENWLAHAPSNPTTLRQVTALRQYLEVLGRENVFTAEGQGHDSMTVLLHNLVTPLQLLERRLAHEINLHSAREHFTEMKEGVTHALSEAAYYLFCALAAKDRTKLPFSLVNMQARVVNQPLTTALATREGLLLKQWIHSPGVVRTLLPQMDAKDAQNVLARKPVSLFATETPTPLLDEKGQAQAAWLGFLQQEETLAAQLDPVLQALPSGICPLLLEAKTLGSGETPLLSDAIQLHGLLESLAIYQDYLHQCWQLAGFGGDHCVYDQIADAVTSILQELRDFNQALSRRLAHFQERLDRGYKEALDATVHLEWQVNYRTAKASQEKLLGLLKGCDAALKRIIEHAQDTPARAQRRSMAVKAYEALQSAPRFLNQARQQVGLAPKTRYPGLEALPDSKAAGTADPFALSLAPENMSIDQILLVLLPPSSQSLAWLSGLCAATPTTPPWTIFRGSYQRYCYLHDQARLRRIGQDFTRLALNAQTPMTPEKSAFIGELRAQLQEESARIHRLSQNLWWPFHRASIQFFAAWQEGITQKLRSLSQIAVIPTRQRQGISTEGIGQALLITSAVLEEAKGLELRRAARLAPRPLSADARERLARIYQQHSQMPSEQRQGFDTWLANRFDTPLWDANGRLQFALTEADGSAVLDEWAENVIRDSQSTRAECQATLVEARAAYQRAEAHLGAAAFQRPFTPGNE